MLDVGGAWASVGLDCPMAHPSLHRLLSVTVIRTPGSLGPTPIAARPSVLTAPRVLIRNVGGVMNSAGPLSIPMRESPQKMLL